MVEMRRVLEPAPYPWAKGWANSETTSMSPGFKKLNLKEQKEIVVVGAPPSFEPEIASLEGVTVRRSVADTPEIAFSLAFVALLVLALTGGTER